MTSVSTSKGNRIQRTLSSFKNKAMLVANPPWRGRAALALVIAGLLMAVVHVSSEREASVQTSSIARKDSYAKERTLAEVADYLRAGDNRLVRPSPKNKTWKRQDSEACGPYLDQAHLLLASPENAGEQELVDAVHVVILCTTNRPEHRAKLTKHKGVPAAIVSLLETSDTAKAAAAECIWISSFANVQNHEAFIAASAIDKLSRVFTDSTCSSSDCYKAKMWAGAALQNLAAAYCNTEDWGGCEWEWRSKKVNGRFPIQLAKDMDFTINPESIRLELMKNTKLMTVLEAIVCDNVDSLNMGPSERSWPSVAEITTKVDKTVATWGAIGAIRNIALSPEFYKIVSPNLQTCMCAHAVRSPDWLEYTKAQDVIYRLGYEENDVCEPLYDKTKCENLKKWKDYEGNSCKVYEEERWCPEYGSYVPTKEDDWDGDSATYVTAAKACCACGGGTQTKET